MCIIICKPKGEEVSESTLRRCFRKHPHGAGFAYADGERVHIRKGFFNVEDFINKYNKYKDLSVLLHFRWATRGEKTKANCHPFRLSEHQVMAHNGTLTRVRCEKKKSDSWNFAHRILKPLIKIDPKFIYSKAGSKIINLAIGDSNKVTILDTVGNFLIYNERAGEYEGKVWYSNHTYLDVPTTTTKRPFFQSKANADEIIGKSSAAHALVRGKQRSWIDEAEADIARAKKHMDKKMEEDLDASFEEHIEKTGENKPIDANAEHTDWRLLNPSNAVLRRMTDEDLQSVCRVGASGKVRSRAERVWTKRVNKRLKGHMPA